MNIFSNLNLKGNEIQEATLVKGKIGNGYEALTATQAGAGAIKYESGVLKYSTGSGEWITIGTGGAPTAVGGLFGIYKDNTFPSTPDVTTIVPVTVSTGTSLSDVTSVNSFKFQGDNKGTVILSSSLSSTSYSINTTVVKIIYTDVASKL